MIYLKNDTLKTRIKVLVCIPLLLASSFSIATDNFNTSQLNWKAETSGYTTGNTMEYIAPDGYAIVSIAGREKQDNPWVLEVASQKLCTSDETNCNTQSRTLRIQEANVTSNKTAYLGSQRYATGLQVCLNDRNQHQYKKLKGLKLFGGIIRTNGKVKSDRTSQFTRNNCRKWDRRLSCSNGKYIKGIRAHRNRYGFSAISVLCAKASTPPTQIHNSSHNIRISN